MQIIGQRSGKMTYEGKRLYIEWDKLADGGFVKGTKIEMTPNKKRRRLVFIVSNNGENTVSGKIKTGKTIPVIDKAGKEISEILGDCERITISIIYHNKQFKLIVKGEKNTRDTKRETFVFSTELKSITFCAGAGISSEAMKQAGFKEVAAVEWNPKEGKEDKFSRLYSQNHPDSIMFNVPMEHLDAKHLPYADIWLGTLDCTDYSKSSNGTNKGLHTMHLFMHLMRLFWQKPKEERPIAILIENVPEFEKNAGNSLELCFKEEGFFVSKTILNSIDFGSRTQRKRFFMLATMFEGFSFPMGAGVKTTPITQDGLIAVEDLEWVTPETHGTLQYFINRQKGKMTHNHIMTVFDITKDSYIGTITKSHHKIQPENWIKHPWKKDTYAYLKAEHIKAIQGIPSHLYLGDSNKIQVESMGQAVCYTSFKKVAESVYQFLKKSVDAFFKNESVIGNEFEQMCFNL